MARRTKRWLRRGAWGVIGLAALLIATYGYMTNPVRLRARALAALGELHLESVEVDSVTFGPRSGLELRGLSITPSGSAGPERPVSRLHIGGARIACGWISLLLGRVHPTRIELSDVSIAYVCDPAGDGRDLFAPDARARSQAAWQTLATWTGKLPRVTLSEGDLQVLVLDGGRLRLLERLRFTASGRATSKGYQLRVDRLAKAETPLAEADWTPATGELSVAADWADVDVIAGLVPPRVAEAVRRLKLAGRVRLEQLVLRRRDATEPDAGRPGPELALAKVRVADARLVLPVEASEASLADRSITPFAKLTDATADIVYDHAPDGGESELGLELSGRLNGAPTTLNLRVAGAAGTRMWRGAAGAAGSLSLNDVRQAELRVLGLELPTAQSYPAFVRSPRLPHPVLAALREYEPHGKVNLRIAILPPGTGATMRVEGEIEALGTSCRYFRFPYGFTDARGHLRFADGRILLDGLSGRHGCAWVRADGVVNSTASWTGLSLTFRGQDVALAHDLYAALPESYRRLWESAAPLGLCDVTAAISRPDGTAQTGAMPATVRVSAQLLGASLSLGDGRRLDHVEGQLAAQNDTVHVRNLHGYQDATSVRLDGDLQLVGGKVHSTVGVEIADLPIEHTASLMPGGGETAPQLHLSGRADVWGRIDQAGDASSRSEAYTVRIKEGALHGGDPARHWTDVRGWATVHDGLRRVVSFTCQQGAARFEAAGTLPDAGAAGGGLHLDLHASAPALEELPPQFLTPEWRRIADAVGAAGEGEVTVHLRPGGKDAAGGQTAEVGLRAARLKPQPLPLDLRDAAVRATLGPGRCAVPQATAQWGDAGRIEAHGDGGWQDGDWHADFALSGRGLTFNPELIDALPGPLSRVLKHLVPRGGFDLLLSRVHASGGSSSTWELEGSLPLKGVGLHLGVALTDVEGELGGSAALGPEGACELKADFSIHKGVLAGRPIERWEGQLRHTPGDRWVRLDDLRGRLCDGDALGEFTIDPETGEYELSLTLQDVSAAELLPASKEQPGRGVRGRVDGRVYVRGKGAAVAGRQGGGEVRIRGSSFLQTPLLASLARAGRPAEAPISDAVDRAEVRFLLEGDEVRIVRIDIQSRDLRLVGEGTWSLHDDALHLTLVGAHPENWPRVAVLSELLEAAGQKLVQYRVAGTLGAPQVTTEPLHELSATLRALVGEAAGQGSPK